VILKTVLLLVLFCPQGINAIELPCWQKVGCYSNGNFQRTDFGRFFIHRPAWHKELDDIKLDMRRGRDYSILWNSSKDRIPIIHSEDSDRAVEELAGDVASSVLSPLAYRIPLLVRIDHEKRKFDSRLDSAIPEIRGVVYALSIKPRVDFSRTNPVSLEAKFSNGKEIARFVLRLREAEVSTPFLKNIHVAGGYSFKDNGWYMQLVGKVVFPW
jgi:hypothetical protein